MYHYAGNNPIRYTDPDGRFPVHIVVGVVVGAAIGAVSAACNGGSAREIAAGALAGVAAHNAEHLVTGEPTSVGSNLEAGIYGAEAVMTGKCLEKVVQGVGNKISQIKNKINPSVTSGNSNSKINFRNDELLNNHFTKHGNEFGVTSKNEYLNKANNFIQSSDFNIMTKMRPNEDKLFYSPQTNEFAVTSQEVFFTYIF